MKDRGYWLIFFVKIDWSKTYNNAFSTGGGYMHIYDLVLPLYRLSGISKRAVPLVLPKGRPSGTSAIFCI